MTEQKFVLLWIEISRWNVHTAFAVCVDKSVRDFFAL